MLNDGRQFLLVAPHLTTYPGLAIMITVLALNLVGDELQEPARKPIVPAVQTVQSRAPFKPSESGNLRVRRFERLERLNGLNHVHLV